MRLASAQICYGTVNNCITWNGALSVTFTVCLIICVCVCWVGGLLQPQLARNGVTSHALNYCTFVAGRQSAANCLSVDQTANISTVGSATSPPLIPTHCLFPTHFLYVGFLSPPSLTFHPLHTHTHTNTTHCLYF